MFPSAVTLALPPGVAAAASPGVASSTSLEIVPNALHYVTASTRLNQNLEDTIGSKPTK